MYMLEEDYSCYVNVEAGADPGLKKRQARASCFYPKLAIEYYGTVSVFRNFLQTPDYL